MPKLPQLQSAILRMPEWLEVKDSCSQCHRLHVKETRMANRAYMGLQPQPWLNKYIVLTFRGCGSSTVASIGAGRRTSGHFHFGGRNSKGERETRGEGTRSSGARLDLAPLELRWRRRPRKSIPPITHTHTHALAVDLEVYTAVGSGSCVSCHPFCSNTYA